MKTKHVIIFLMVMGFSVSHSQRQSISSLKPLNIDFMNRGYFYAASPQMDETAGLGGWADSGNMFIKMQSSDRFQLNALSIHVNMNEAIAFAEKFAGTVLYVANTLPDTVFFDAQDSRLEMFLQAQDKNGEWKAIEYLPSSWCGNSYHMVYLPSKCYWKFTIPLYEGKMKTKLRAVLSYKGKIDGGDLQVFSNEFEGSVNPGQFSKKPDYKPNGIMDPYNN